MKALPSFSHRYTTVVVPALMKEWGYMNALQVPKVIKVTVNVGVGKALKDSNILDSVEHSLLRITGQKPVRTKAKKSIANFKVRQGVVLGVKVTLRKKRMYDFLEKLVAVALPRIRDFRGLELSSVDAQGNLSIGFKENLAFPEIKSDEIEHTHGLEITISTNAHSYDRGVALFSLLGFPFKKRGKKE